MSTSTMSRNTFIGRFPAPVIPEGHISISSNMANTFDAANNASSSSGNTHIIDVIPNMRLQFAALAEEFINVYGSLDPKTSEYASPPALLGYCAVLIHAHAYLTDSYYREGSSSLAAAIENSSTAREFFDDLLNLPVPPMVHDILKGLARYRSEAHNGLSFIHTYAGCRFKQDFPFLVPASMFFAAHDVLANAPSNAQAPTLVDLWFRSPILQIGNSRSAATTYRVGQFLGSLFDIDNSTYVHNDWFSERMMRVFTPVTQRYHKTRPFFNPINVECPLLRDAAAEFNPYIYGTGFTESRRMHLQEVLSKLGDFVKVQFKTTHTLGQVLTSNTGSNIVNHFISDLLLPMHHTKNLGPHVPQGQTGATPRPDQWLLATDDNMASATNFMQPEANVNPANNAHKPPRVPTFKPFAPGNPPTEGPDTQAFTEALYLVSSTTLTADSATPPKWTNYPYTRVIFDATKHVAPDLIFSAPLNAPTSAIFSSAIAGLWLQCNEVDAISVPTHHPGANIALTNTEFNNGLVPIGSTPNFAENEAIVTRARSVPSLTVFRSAVSLYDYSTNFLGRLATAIPAAITAPTGFSVLNGIRYGWEQFSLFTFNSGRTTQLNGTKQIQVWSPYRYVKKEASRDLAFFNMYPGYQAPSTDDDAVMVYTSIRGLFGTDTRTYGFPFPASRFK